MSFCIDDKILDEMSIIADQNNIITSDYYEKYDVKRGLRNNNGTGVLTGLTKVGDVHGYIVDDGEKISEEGKLRYRGIDVYDIVRGFQKGGYFGFEETCYLLLFGRLPDKKELEQFNEIIGELRELPEYFTEDMILKAPSKDIMNKLARSVLALYSYDDNPDDLCTRNVLRQSIELIARFATLIAYGYQAKAHYHDHKSLIIHSPQKNLSTAENLLYMIRPDNKYSKGEAELLDLALVLHAEHGGGNNSAFATHVVSSSGTDTYSAIAAAVGSLKGPKHGGANIKVMGMLSDIKFHVKDWEDKDEIENYLFKILQGDAFDGRGLIYGIGHAVYTLSDPRAVLLKKKAADLAKIKGRIDEFNLYKNIQEISPKLFGKVGIHKQVSANVDFYSGFVYDMLNIPEELFTPIFATARIPGWCAHRIEQLVSEPRIIRPAYKSVSVIHEYTPLEKRE